MEIGKRQPTKHKEIGARGAVVLTLARESYRDGVKAIAMS
jgi:hypothetical protein